MSKFNQRGTRPLNVQGSGTPLITTEPTPTTRTFEGAPGYRRGPKGELFLLAVNNLVGEKTFYENGKVRDDRYRELVHAVAQQDPEWVVGLTDWLRRVMNLRTVALVTAAELVRFCQLNPGLINTDAYTSGGPLGGHLGPSRRAVNCSIQRGDEPGEIIGYWLSQYGRKIPKALKRGVADASRRLYNERSLLKYDTTSAAVRFADVLELTHPAPAPGKTAWQGQLFKHAIDRRHGRGAETPGALRVVAAQHTLREQVAADPTALLDETALAKSGMTWEDTLSLAGTKVPKKDVWESMIPSMGYMALLRNLRNFDEAGVSDVIAATVAARLCDPEEVRNSRQLPMRFFSAWHNTASLRWASALEAALTLSTRNVPALAGKTLVLVDTSGSMERVVSEKSTVRMVDLAALFGCVLAVRNPGAVDLVGFADSTFLHHPPVRPGSSILKALDLFSRRIGEVGHGTQITRALRERFDHHDRVILISDMQTMHMGGSAWSGYSYENVTTAIPADVPMYGFNLVGYAAGVINTGPFRHELGGLSDATFSMIPLMELGQNMAEAWPWETDAHAAAASA